MPDSQMTSIIRFSIFELEPRRVRSSGGAI